MRSEDNNEVGMELKGHGHGIFICLFQNPPGSNEEKYKKP
jgi:hypothetical protein